MFKRKRSHESWILPFAADHLSSKKVLFVDVSGVQYFTPHHSYVLTVLI